MATKLDIAKRIAGAVPVTRHASAGAFDAASTTRWGTVTAIDSDGNATIQLDGSDDGDTVTLATETTPNVGDRATVIHEGGTWKVISLSKVAADAAAGAQAGTDAAEALAKVEDVESHFWYDEGVGCRISTEKGKPYGASNALWQADKLLFRTRDRRIMALTTGYQGVDPTTGETIIDQEGVGLSIYDGQGNSASNILGYLTWNEVALARRMASVSEIGDSASAHVLMCEDQFDIQAVRTMTSSGPVTQGFIKGASGVVLLVPHSSGIGTLGEMGVDAEGDINIAGRDVQVASDGDVTIQAPQGGVVLSGLRGAVVSGPFGHTGSSVTLSSPGAWRSAILSTAFARPSANISISTGGTDTKLTCATFQTTDSDAFESYDGGIRCKRAGTLRVFGSLSFRITTTDAMGTIAIYRNSSSIAYTMSGVSSGSQYGYAGINGWLQTVAAGDVIYLYANLALAGTVSARGSWLSLEFMD